MKLFIASALSAPLALNGCSKTCESYSVVSDTTSASYTASGSLFASSPDAGSGGAGSGAVSDVDLQQVGGIAGNPATIQMTGNLLGGNASFTITIPINPGSSGALPSSAQVCVSTNTGSPCATLAGTLDTSTYTYPCDSGSCALTITGTLKGTATLDGSSFSIDASIAHAEELTSEPCGFMSE